MMGGNRKEYHAGILCASKVPIRRQNPYVVTSALRCHEHFMKTLLMPFDFFLLDGYLGMLFLSHRMTYICLT